MLGNQFHKARKSLSNAFDKMLPNVKEYRKEYFESYPEIVLETIFTPTTISVALVVCSIHAMRSYLTTGDVRLIFFHLLGPISFALTPRLAKFFNHKIAYLLINNITFVWMPTWIAQLYLTSRVDPNLLPPAANSHLLAILIFMNTHFPKRWQALLLASISAFSMLYLNYEVRNIPVVAADIIMWINTMGIGIFFNLVVSGLIKYKFLAKHTKIEIESILESTPQAIFKLHLNEKGTISIGTIRSRSASNILGLSTTNEGNDFAQLLANVVDSKSTCDYILSLVRAVLNESLATFERNRESFPREIQVKVGPRTQILTISWVPMPRISDNIVDSILVSATDVTDQRKTEIERDIIKVRQGCLIELTNAGKMMSKKFIKKAEESLQKSKAMIENGVSKDVIDQVFVVIHSIKGASHSLKMTQITEISHSFEMSLSKARKLSFYEGYAESFLREIDHLARAIDQYKDIMEHDLFWIEGEDNNEEISASDIKYLIETEKSLAQKILSDRPSSSLARLIAENCPSLSSLLLEVASSSAEISARLSKPLPHFSIEGKEVRFLEAGSRAIESALNHLLNNSLDHGLESPADRLLASKDSVGTISVNVKEVDGGILISWADDGRGIDLREVLAKATGQGLIQGNASPRQAAKVILAPGFSTKENVTHISGRGVGLHAVVDAVENLGGKVDVVLKKKLPSERFPFEITIFMPSSSIFLVEDKQSTEAKDERNAQAKTHSPNLPRVLVVDDDEVQQLIVSRFLKRANCSVDIANDGNSAIAMATANVYDLILMDVVLSEDCGFEVAKNINEIVLKKGVNTRIIGMTGTIFEDQDSKRHESGMVKLLPKPLSIANIEEFIGCPWERTISAS